MTTVFDCIRDQAQRIKELEAHVAYLNAICERLRLQLEVATLRRDHQKPT